jgi:hypothetical protein
MRDCFFWGTLISAVGAVVIILGAVEFSGKDQQEAVSDIKEEGLRRQTYVAGQEVSRRPHGAWPWQLVGSRTHCGTLTWRSDGA